MNNKLKTGLLATGILVAGIGVGATFQDENEASTETGVGQPSTGMVATTHEPTTTTAITTTTVRPTTTIPIHPVVEWIEDGHAETFFALSDSMIELYGIIEVADTDDEMSWACLDTWFEFEDNFDAYALALARLDSVVGRRVYAAWYDTSWAFIDRCSDFIIDGTTIGLMSDANDATDDVIAWLEDTGI